MRGAAGPRAPRVLGLLTALGGVLNLLALLPGVHERLGDRPGRGGVTA